MATFQYSGIDANGSAVTGTIRAVSMDAAVQQVRDQGVFVQKCHPVDGVGSTATSDVDEGSKRGVVSDGQISQPGVSRSSPVVVVLLSLFALGGIAITLSSAWNVLEMTRQLKAAVSIRGTVLSSEVRQVVTSSPDLLSRTSHSIPAVQYQYLVNGRTFSNSQIYPGEFSVWGPEEDRLSTARRIVRQYPPKSEITVWYLPDEPATAFLIPLRRVNHGILMLLGALLAAPAAGLLLRYLDLTRYGRFLWAVGLFSLGQSITWLGWAAFIAVAPEQVSGATRLFGWLMVAYVILSWTVMIAHSPPALASIREATIACVSFGTLVMSLSLFILIPLTLLAPGLNAMRAFPWVGVVSAVVALGLWGAGVLRLVNTGNRSTDQN